MRNAQPRFLHIGVPSLRIRYGMVKKAEKGNPIKVIEDNSAESDGGPTSYLEIDVRTEQWCKVR